MVEQFLRAFRFLICRYIFFFIINLFISPPPPHVVSLSGLCDNIIQDIIYSFLVLPNRITIPLVGEAQLAQLRFPMPKVTHEHGLFVAPVFLVSLQPPLTPPRLSPQGILRIHFIEAQDLLGKDKFLGGLIKGKSDPYGVIQIGNQLFQSKVVHETVHPKWNEVYEVSDAILSVNNLHLLLICPARIH